MTRRTALITALTLTIGLTACGGDDSSSDAAPETVADTEAPATTVAPTTTEAPTTTAAPTTTVADEWAASDETVFLVEVCLTSTDPELGRLSVVADTTEHLTFMREHCDEALVALDAEDAPANLTDAFRLYLASTASMEIAILEGRGEESAEGFDGLHDTFTNVVRSWIPEP